MKTERWTKIAGMILISLGLFRPAGPLAQPAPSADPFIPLDTRVFNDTSWLSDLGGAPASFTNLNPPPGFDGNALQVEGAPVAGLQYTRGYFKAL